MSKALTRLPDVSCNPSIPTMRERQCSSLSRIARAQRDAHVTGLPLSVAMGQRNAELQDEHAGAVLFEADGPADGHRRLPEVGPWPKKEALQVIDSQGFRSSWWRFTDSNRGPVDYDSI
jgi:hypothetical protein